jgi:putative ABC transport system permease protein
MIDDLKFAFRALRKAPAFCTVVIVTLALGIGANTAVFSVLHAAILTPLPYPAPQDLVRLYFESGGERSYLAGSPLIEVRDQSRTLDVATSYTYSERSVDLTDRGRPERVAATLVSANYFDVWVYAR